jgi:N-acetylmuramic acid 6-phosphate etherase
MSPTRPPVNGDPAIIEARRFIEEETQFHLGVLPTEGSHPNTRNFSATVLKDTAAGAAMLLSVDHDIPPRAAEVFRSAEYAALVQAIVRASLEGRRIGFSGCGATGRLAIILERMWREFWEAESERAGSTDPAWAADCRRRADSGYSIMTGGDRALIRSVENFEDFQEFGRRQVRDLGLGSGDLLVAITEGGETSSVIGTAREAFERGCTVFFIFNNPAHVLAANIERSRAVIECPGIEKIDLFTGAMALSGSTRLQATSAEMLVVGAALEQAAARIVEESRPRHGGPAARPTLGGDPGGFFAIDATATFERLVDALSSGPALAGLAAAIELESEIYRAGGLVTYVSEEYLLDIISDTTERTPTFKLPPFRPTDDTSSPPSWAFVKDPARATRDAWDHMLRRAPRGIAWTREDYIAMKGTDRMIANPPALDTGEIYRYGIGNEPDASRCAAPASALIAVTVGSEPSEALRRYLAIEGRGFTRRTLLAIDAPEPGGRADDWPAVEIPLPHPRTPMNLFAHLAVKLVFNTLSTCTMGKRGRIWGNWMIQVDATNKKLVDRATRIISALGGIGYEEACIELHRTLAEPRTRDAGSDDSCVVRTLRRMGRSPVR